MDRSDPASANRTSDYASAATRRKASVLRVITILCIANAICGEGQLEYLRKSNPTRIGCCRVLKIRIVRHGLDV